MKPRICITRIADPNQASCTVVERTEQHLDVVRARAFDHFEQRGGSYGNDWEDWLRAEREVLWKPPAELFENQSALVLRVAVPGFSAPTLQVIATPTSLLVQGSEEHWHDGLEHGLHFCEFGQRLFRRFDLPKAIDPNRMAATLDQGILEIVAPLARPAPEAPPEAAEIMPAAFAVGRQASAATPATIEP